MYRFCVLDSSTMFLVDEENCFQLFDSLAMKRISVGCCRASEIPVVPWFDGWDPYAHVGICMFGSMNAEWPVFLGVQL